MPTIEIYTQPFCPYCTRAVSLLTKKGATFKTINAPQGTPARDEAVSRYGGRSPVPQMFIGGALDRTGRLDALLAG